MKILITHFSQTGNTKKIATAIYEEALKIGDAEIKDIDEISPEVTLNYDFIVIGSPLHSGSLASPVQTFIGGIKAKQGQKIAAFITHFAPGYPDQDMEGFALPVINACEEKGIEYIGCFDCQGFLTETLHKAVQKKMNQTDEQWAKTVKQMTGRPNQEDVENARAFAREIFS